MAKTKRDLWQEAHMKPGKKVAHANLTTPRRFGTVVEVKNKTVLIDFNGTIKECQKKEVTVLWN